MTLFLLYRSDLPDWVDMLQIFLMPGYVLSIVANRNIHVPNLFVAALGNFFLYYLVAWAVLKLIYGDSESEEVGVSGNDLDGRR